MGFDFTEVGAQPLSGPDFDLFDDGEYGVSVGVEAEGVRVPDAFL